MASKTGRFLNCHGQLLAVINEMVGVHSTIEVDGISYYTWDFGGFVVGSRMAKGTDYGGNLVHGERTAPTSLMGLAAPLGRGALPCRIDYGEPEIVSAGHSAKLSETAN